MQEVPRSFIVTLTHVKYQQEYKYEDFTRRFPNSLITNTLGLTNELEVPIDKAFIKQETLQLLSQILTEKQYPYVPDSKTIQKQLDYLGIDLPCYVYDPSYPHFTEAYPEVNLYDFKIEPYYDALKQAREWMFPALARYIFSVTNGAETVHDDYDMFHLLLLDPFGFATDDELGALILTMHPKVFDAIKYGTRLSLIPTCIDGGYAKILEILTRQYQLTYTAKDFWNLLERIRTEPGHIENYALTIDLVLSHLDRSEAIGPVQSVYISVKAKSTVLLENVVKDCWRSVYVDHNVMISLLWLFHHFGDIEYLSEFMDYYDAGEIIDLGGTSPVDNFYVNYLKHPELIKKDILKVLGSYIRSQPRVRSGVPATVSGINQLMKGIEVLTPKFPQLALVLEELL